MSAGTFLFALLRVVVALAAAGVAGRRLATGLGYAADALGRLAAAVLAISLVLVWATALGLVGGLRSGPLIAGLLVTAGAAWTWAAKRRAQPARESTAPVPAAPERPPTDSRAWTPTRLLAALAAAVVLTQWLLSTANALGGGMYNFDTLWYHMPFAAGFAQSGSVAGIHFTQADPWVAYYPANSELVHAVGLVLLHGDLLSPLVNLGWLAVLLPGAWCFGRPWGREPETLIAGCLLAGLPVLASTQPGEAFNDIAGLAMLVAGCALLVNRGSPIPAGLALGFAIGVKFTFLVPVAVIVLGTVAIRRRRAAALVLALLATGGWWYLRNLIRIGTPLGTRLHLGPIVLAGPYSPLASSEQQTVLSEVRHLSLWGSRFIPGLTHSFGVLWPVLLVGGLSGLAVILRAPGPPGLKVIALAAVAAAVIYIVLPTGATGIGTSTALFEVNLRYTTPAAALTLLLVPAALGARWVRWSAVVMVLALLAAQAERSLWPASPSRHAGFALVAAAVTAVGVVAWEHRSRLREPRIPAAAAAILAGVAATFAAGYVIQRHYLQRRYRTVAHAQGALYLWAQSISHARIALYGTLEQYPLYGALVTNRVDYLGAPTSDGGFVPIADCRTWRAAVNRARAQYVVMTPGPTGVAPLRWTAGDPAARQLLVLGPDARVLTLTGPLDPRGCGA